MRRTLCKDEVAVSALDLTEVRPMDVAGGGQFFWGQTALLPESAHASAKLGGSARDRRFRRRGMHPPIPYVSSLKIQGSCIPRLYTTDAIPIVKLSSLSNRTVILVVTVHRNDFRPTGPSRHARRLSDQRTAGVRLHQVAATPQAD